MSDNYKKYGDQSYKWAFEDATAPAIPGMRITELNVDSEPEFSESGQNEEGLTAVLVKTASDSDKKNFSGSGFLLDADDFDGAEGFEFRGRYFIIMKKGEKYNHRGLQKCDFSGESYKLITGP